MHQQQSHTRPAPFPKKENREHNKKNGSHNYRINTTITCPEVRVINNGENKIIPTKKAIDIAKGHNLDLIEISPTAKPPVCKFGNFSKFLYDLEKSKKVDKTPKVKEVQLRTNIAEHDFQTKIRQAQEFLTDNHPVTIKLQFRGREAAHKNLGIETIKRFSEALATLGREDGTPKLNGKSAFLRIVPKKNLDSKNKDER